MSKGERIMKKDKKIQTITIKGTNLDVIGYVSDNYTQLNLNTDATPDGKYNGTLTTSIGNSWFNENDDGSISIGIRMFNPLSTDQKVDSTTPKTYEVYNVVTKKAEENKITAQQLADILCSMYGYEVATFNKLDKLFPKK